ncbi:hypothetical protein RISK_000403 [Rhodopirellula islandica]|uniref:Uncharacterized protein n=1 Tax=Rhodopirellula islandica TaxID=595434 RepID=A0A0J1BLC1_RHOIS|nr:hypothetical protein RISK_000403 [Rhodopirellula islandica]
MPVHGKHFIRTQTTVFAICKRVQSLTAVPGRMKASGVLPPEPVACRCAREIQWADENRRTRKKRLPCVN